MICFICKKHLLTFASLISHYKIIHLLGPHSSYTCSENNCTQSFQTLSSFKKHFIKKHSIENHLDKSETNNEILINNDIVNFCDVQMISNEVNNDETFKDFQNLPEIPLIKVEIDINKSIEQLHMSAVGFALSLHNNNNFCRSDVLNIIDDIEDKIIKPITSLLEGVTKSEISDPLILSKFSKITSAISGYFKLCKTEYLLTKCLTTNELLCDTLHQFTINNEINLVSHNGHTMYDENITKGVLMPLKYQFKKYFELNNNLNIQLKRYNNLISYPVSDENCYMTNFIQGSLWKEKIAFYHDKIVVPFFMYIDDFEINNPLGSKSMKHAISAVYYSFPLNEQSSKLNNIFLAALLKSQDLKSFGNDLCFKQLIEEFNSLEKNGILIHTPDGPKEVHFILGLVIGDNLGLNSVCDFGKSFAANYFCRFCKAHKTLTHTLSQEDATLIRNIENYEQDVEINDFSQTGVSQNSILNNINYFHVTTNFCVDVMHDIFEGICHYNMCHIINYYTGTIQILSLDTLNFRKQHFNYGELEQKNLSPPIEKHHLSKFHLKMSARQMMSFVHFFPLMIGDLIPDDDEVWLFFLNFLEIIEILLSHELTQKSSVPRLKFLINKHNSDYILYFKDNLKPKHHILTHYPSIILKSGPPRHFWCFQYEAKHKELKMYARAITSRKNICLTLAKKYTFKFAHFLLNKQNNKEFIVFDKHIINSDLEFLSNNVSISSSNIISFSNIDFKGTIYKVGSYVTCFKHNLCLYKILEIVMIKNSAISFIVDQIQLDSYSSHMRAYEVSKTQNIILKTLISIKEFSGPPIDINQITNGKLMIRLKDYF